MKKNKQPVKNLTNQYELQLGFETIYKPIKGLNKILQAPVTKRSKN